jgi:hypothetical protein
VSLNVSRWDPIPGEALMLPWPGVVKVLDGSLRLVYVAAW